MKRLLSLILIVSLMMTAMPMGVSAASQVYQSGEWSYTLSNDKATLTAYAGHAASVTIPSAVDGYTVVRLESNMFQGRLELTAVTMPDTVETLGTGVFKGCTSLSQVILSKGLKSIGEASFGNCTALKAITIPASLESCGFYGPWGGSVFAGCGNLQSVSFETGTTHIATGLFYNAHIRQITIPSTVTEIKDNAFVNCPLTAVTIPDSVTVLGINAFRGCTSLSKVTLSKNLKSMGEGAFAENPSLTTIEIPASLESVGIYDPWGGGAFAGCTNMKTATFEAGITRIPSGVFYNSSIERITIPATVTEIGNDAFKKCPLTGIALPTGLTKIGGGAFLESALQSIVIPDTVTTIEGNAFKGCASLSRVTLSKALKTMGEGAFGNCTSLTTVEIPASLESCGTYGPWGGGVFAGCTNMKTATFEAGITRIPSGVFHSASIEYITIPNTVTEIGGSAFEKCPLPSITIPEGVQKIGGGAFLETGLKSVVIPDTVTAIDGNAFKGCQSLAQVTLSKNLKTMSEGVFGNCTALTSIEIPASLESCANYGPWGGSVFAGCTNLKTAIIAEGSTHIAGCVFHNSSVENVIVPDTVTEIRGGAFENCKQLTRITLPDHITKMDVSVFRNSPVTLYLKEDSETVITAIDYQFPFILTETGIADAPDRNLNREVSIYQPNSNTVSQSGYLTLNATYGFKEEAADKVSDLSLILRLPKEVAWESFKLNGKAVTPNNRDNLLTLPLSASAGTLTFFVKPQEVEYLLSYARIRYTLDEEEHTETLGVVNMGNKLFTLGLSDTTNQDTFEVTGITNPEQEIEFFIDGESVGKTTASKTGSYTAELTLEDPISNRQYEVSATTKFGNETETKIGHIRYCEDAPALTEFRMIYEHGHTGQTKEVDMLSLDGARPLITAYIYTPMTFVVGIDNPENVEQVFVTSNKNGTVKKIPATYDEKTQTFVATGYFDPANISYMPGILNVEYTSKKKTQTILPGDDVDFTQFADSLPDALKNSEADITEKGDNETEVTLNLSKDAADVGFNEVKLVVTTFDETMEEFDAVFSMYDTLFSYAIEGYDGDKYYKALDFSDPNTYVMVVHDASSNKIIRYTLEAFEDSKKLPVSDWLDTMDTISTVSGTVLDFVGAETDYEDMCDKIYAANMTPDEQAKALKRAEDLKHDKQAFTVVTAIISAVVACSGPAAMVTAPLVFSVLLGSMNVAADFFWGMREAQLLSGSNGFSMRWIMDPSGYVYDAVTNERLEGVTVTLYHKETADSPVVLWNAEEYEQENPLTTDKDGRYAWDVPEGLWQVKAEMEGYETAYSDWLPVPPPQLDVNIGMYSLNATFLPGDVDISGQIQAADALLALQAATGKVTLSQRQAGLADVDGKVGITANDALLILQYATQKITAFPNA